MKSIVSITPISLGHDSRTLKQVVSAARAGHRSVVLEARPSPVSLSCYGLILHALHGSDQGETPPTSPCEGPSGPPRGMLGRILDILRTYLWDYGLKTLIRLPKGDLYHVHAPYQFPAAYLTSRLRGVPLVYDSHDLYTELIPQELQSPLERRVLMPLLRILERACVKKSAEVITVCDGLATRMQQLYGRTPLVVRNAHDTRLDKPLPKGLRETLGLDENAFLIVFPGQCKVCFAIREALEAMRELPEHVHLAFLGRGYGPFEPEFIRMGLEDRIHVVPPVQPNEVVPFIASADAYALLLVPSSTNFMNALPNGFFQGVAAGLPLLYPSLLPEITRLAERHDLGLPVDPADAAAVARAAKKLIDDPARCKRYRANAAKAHTELAWEREEQILTTLYETLLAKPAKDA